METIRYFYVGQEVKWNDTALLDYAPEDRDDILNRTFRIVKFLDDESNSALIKEENGPSEAEVYVSELEPLEWDWCEHAEEVLRLGFGDIDEELREDFIYLYWNDLETDDENCSTFVKWLESVTPKTKRYV